MEDKLSKSIKEKVLKSLPNSKVEIENFSKEHYGHDSGGAHIQIDVIDASFKDLNTLKQHQVIYKILDEELKSGKVHALKISTKNE